MKCAQRPALMLLQTLKQEMVWLGLYCDSSYRSVMFWLKMKESQDPWLEQLSKFSKILLQKGYN